jgi:hypothetical protein
VGLKLNWIHQLPAYADYVNLVGDNADSINGNTGTLIDTIIEVSLEVNVEKTYVFVLSPECRSKSGHQNSKHRLKMYRI